MKKLSTSPLKNEKKTAKKSASLAPTITKKATQRDKIGIYVHIPFCASKCNYCDFNSYAEKGELITPYFEAMEREIELVAIDFDYNKKVGSVFIGGGTPTLMEGIYIETLMELLHASFPIEKNAEISIECNPGTLTMEKLCKYRRVGINRISFGLQACQNELLDILGRKHSWERFYESYQMARLAGFANINIDLIFGIPGQTMADWKETLQRVTALKPEHISCYSLKIEEGTPFYEMSLNKMIVPVDDDVEREMYYFTNTFLKKHGFIHYEISNYAKDGYRCAHNMIYWKGGEYLGFGAGAHAYIYGKRTANTRLPEDYIEQIELDESVVVETNVIDNKESMNEYMMLGLRLVEGIRPTEFKKKFQKNIQDEYSREIQDLQDRGLIIADENIIRLSNKGLDFANQVFGNFIKVE